MNLALWIAVGVAVGLLVAVLTGGARWKHASVDAVIGVAGAVPFGWFLSGISSNPDSNSLRVSGLVGAFVGGAALTAIYEIMRP